MPCTLAVIPLHFIAAGEGTVGARIFSRLISLPFNYLYCILVVKIGEMELKNGKQGDHQRRPD